MAAYFYAPADGSPTTVTTPPDGDSADTLSAREAADGARHAADDAMSLLRCMFEAAADEAQKRELQAMICDVRRQQRDGEIDGVTRHLALRARVILGRERWHEVVQRVKASAEARASAERRRRESAGEPPADARLALLLARRHAAAQRAKAARRGAAPSLAVIEERSSELSSGSEASPTSSPQPRPAACSVFDEGESPEGVPAIEVQEI